MNLKEIRDSVFARADWAPTTSPEAVTRVNRFINDAYMELAEDAPYLFSRSMSIRTVPVFESQSDTDTLEVYGLDLWVMKTALPSSGLTHWQSKIAGALIELTTSDGTVYYNRVREVWVATVFSFNYYIISLLYPWGGADTDTDIRYRIYYDRYPMPHDFMALQSVRVLGSTANPPMTVIGADEAESAGYKSPGLSSSGKPVSVFDAGFEQLLPTPKYTPATVTTATPWTPQSAGTFSYAYCLAIGANSTYDSVAGPVDGGTSARRNTYRFISAPSPVGAEVTAVFNTTSIDVTLPDIDNILGFDANTPPVRAGRTGVRVLLFRRRHTVVGPGIVQAAGPNQKSNIWTDAGYYFFGDYDPSTTSVVSDIGEVIPDAFFPMPDAQGQRCISFYPTPNDAYQIAIRYNFYPRRLVDDLDVPAIPTGLTSALIESVLSKLLEFEKDYVGSARAESKYNARLRRIATNVADLRPDSLPLRRREARVRGSRTSRQWYQED